MDHSFKKKYLEYYKSAQNLLLKFSNAPQLLEDSNVQQRIMQLKDVLGLPVTEGSAQFLGRTISYLEQYIPKESNQNYSNEAEGREVGYTKVKKSGNAFVPVEEDSKDIEVPNFNIPIPMNRGSLRQEPDYIFKDTAVRISPIPNDYNRGSSHVLMLAFLTFFMESLFLLLSFFLYQ